MAEIIKAIIPVAGWGTRMLPITKAIEKCMLPVGKRPIIDYVVQDCLAAGIREFIFVVSEQSSQLEAYYRSNIHLNDYLRRKGKEDMLPLIAPLKANMHFVTQPSYGKYGTAVPVALASDYINTDESAVVLMGDDFMYNPDGSSEVARLIAATPAGAAYWRKKYRMRVLAVTARLSLMRVVIFAKLLRSRAPKKRQATMLISVNMF